MSAHTSIAGRGAADLLSPIGGFAPHHFDDLIKKANPNGGEVIRKVILFNGTVPDFLQNANTLPGFLNNQKQKTSFREFTALRKAERDVSNSAQEGAAFAVENDITPLAGDAAMNPAFIRVQRSFVQTYGSLTPGQRIPQNGAPASSETDPDDLATLMSLALGALSGHSFTEAIKEEVAQESTKEPDQTRRDASPRPN